ncbi:MAG: elongation factor 1-beta [Candidatus Pacearchaeota archaeon]|nr:elongation factor 1-beta [Candidatus Pacearchaeota archaeon]
MAMAALKIKILPDNLEADLEKLEEEVRGIIEKFGKARLHKVEKEEIAFGLKALILTIAWPEEIDQYQLEEKLRKIKHVDSVEVIDFRRAVG